MKGTLGVFVIAITALIVGIAIGSAGNDVAPDSPKTLAGAKVAKPKNVILLIGDGMGISEITAARYYNGARNPLNVDRFKYTGFGTSWSVKPGTSAKPLPDYLPDSASTATQWATGVKTNDGRLSQTVTSAANVPGKPLKSIAEILRARGMRTGNVTTTDLTDATPASISSHISLRLCQGPSDMSLCPSETRASGGLGSIAEQTVNAKFDVLLGGGRARFAQTIAGGPDAGRTVLEVARSRGYQYVGSAASLESSNSRKPVLGLFNEEDISTNWSGPAAALGKGNAPVACTEGQRPAVEPSLVAMSRRALKLLDNEKGFFLQIESGSIDKEAHAANACGQIGETIAFDQAVGVALKFQRSHPGTLVIATADHSQSGMIVREDATGGGLPTGYSANLLTRDGQVLALTYGTTGYGGARPSPTKAPVQYHSGAAVPVWAVGPGASRILGTNDHTKLFDVMRGRP